MENAHYHIFGVGVDAGDLRYIGWTEKSVNEEKEEIFSELAQKGIRDLAHWAKEALHGGKLSIFEIESAPSAEDARNSAAFWCRYYHSLGLNVFTDH